MAKQTDTPVQPKDLDVNPQLAFEAAWDADPAIRAVVTRKGRLRGNLRPSDRKRGEEILRSYGL